MTISSPKSGSALLTVLLTLSALAAIMLLATRGMIADSRAVAREESRHLADFASLTGIEEGLTRLSVLTNATLWKEYKYGDVSSQVMGEGQMSPFRRGYTDLACTVLGEAGPVSTADYRDTCPYYDLAVRSKVRLVNISGNIQSFYYLAKALPVNTTITVAVASNLGANLKYLGGVLGCKIEVAAYDSSNVVISTKMVDRTNSPYFVNSSTTKLELTTRDASPGSCSNGLEAPGLQVYPAVPDGIAVIDQAAITIESTGYSNAVKVGKIMTIYHANPSQRVLTPMSGSIDLNGIAK